MNGILVPALYLLAGLCAYAAASHLLHGWLSPRHREHLLFAAMCALMTGAAICAAWGFRADGIATYTTALKTYLALIAPFYLLFAAFVATHTRTPARAFLLVLSVLTVILWVANLWRPYGLQFREIVHLRDWVAPWGETVSLGSGEPSTWFLLALAVLVAVFGFAVGVLIRHYRRERRKATLFLLGGIALFLLATAQGALVRLGLIDFVPLTVFGYLFMILVMSLVLHQETQQRLRDSEQRFRGMVEQAPMGIQVLSPSGVVRQVNRAWEQMHDRSRAETVGRNVLEQPDAIETRIAEPIRTAAAGNLATIDPLPYQPHSDATDDAPDGHWMRGCAYPLRDTAGAVQDVVVVQEDVTLTRRSEDALRVLAQGIQADTREGFFQALVRQLSEVFPADFALVGKRAPDAPDHIDTMALCGQGEILPNFRYELAKTPCETVLDQGICVFPDEVQVLFPEDHMLGDMAARSYLGARMFDSSGSDLGHIAMINRYPLKEVRQTTEILQIFAQRAAAELERLEREENIRQLAFQDSLTGLANRAQLHDALARDLDIAHADSQHGGLILIDLDHFKTINDALGHAVGDTVLAAVADRLHAHAPEHSLTARLGGDEFAVLIHPQACQREGLEDAVAAHAGRLLEALNHPVAIDERTFGVGASLGCVLFPDAGQTAADALRHADIALYQAKGAGRGGVQFYRDALQDAAHARLQIEDGLRQAVARDELHLHYQPQFDRDGRIIGAEALLRWQHPELGDVAPGLFIPVAEETGLIHGIGNWVLDHALATLRHWHHTGKPVLPRLAINISPWQLARPDFVEQVRGRVRAHGVPPGQIVLEVTESGLLRDLGDAVAKLGTLRTFGMRVALDDFGTGYSSLAYLRDLPVDELKIDKSFVDELLQGGDRTLIENIVDIGRNMHLDVIAEGVAHEEQLHQLLELGCTRFQGFLFSWPLPADQMHHKMRESSA
ncbi:MAG: EAL domain-containing protein [Pseudomonadota bacterium]